MAENDNLWDLLVANSEGWIPDEPKQTSAMEEYIHAKLLLGELADVATTLCGLLDVSSPAELVMAVIKLKKEVSCQRVSS